MQNFKIYVAGVHSRTKPLELLHFFESFGPIVSVEPKPCKADTATDTKPSKSGAQKSYWIIEARDSQTYNKILTSKNCILFGRSLCLLPFMDGEDLILHSKLKSKKRVLIKKVPSWVTEEQLLAAIESQIGKVEAYFKYETDSHKAKKLDSKKKIRKVCTYSVTMRNKQDREKFVQAGHLKLTSDITVQVEKYISKKSQMEKNPPEDYAKPVPNLRKDSFNQRPKLGLQVRIDIAKTGWTRKSFSQSTQIGVSPALRAPNKDQQTSQSFIFGGAESGDEDLVLDHFKPTQKRYHCFHRNQIHKLKLTTLEESNLRFNAVGGSSAAL
jgi:hypothetical protein